MKKVICIILAILFVVALFGCGKEKTPSVSPSPDNSSPSPGNTDTPEPEKESEKPGKIDPKDRDPYRIVYLCPGLTIQWCADVAAGLESFEDEYNFELIAAESSNKNDTYLTLLETYCDQDIDGFVLMCPEDIGASAKEIIGNAGKPVLFESIALVDANKKLLTSGVELNAYDCGAGCSRWLAENYKTYLGDVDMSELGFVVVTFTNMVNMKLRSDGALETFEECMPDCKNLFTADLVSQGTGSAEAAYNEVAAVIAGSPNIKYWLVVAVQDAYGQGATRAVEAAGLEDTSLVTSVGGENLILEWEGGYEGCWIACNYFEASFYAAELIPALISVIDGETTVEELWPDWRVEGTNYSSLKISGVMATKDTYKQYASSAR
ncbi:MAG: substrate-binding domain-containing protein [Clostridiales bacterium]|nr:substrate-binding domain-containing protein [Clostridiales bacterium]